MKPTESDVRILIDVDGKYWPVSVETEALWRKCADAVEELPEVDCAFPMMRRGEVLGMHVRSTRRADGYHYAEIGFRLDAPDAIEDLLHTVRLAIQEWTRSPKTSG